MLYINRSAFLIIPTLLTGYSGNKSTQMPQLIGRSLYATGLERVLVLRTFVQATGKCASIKQLVIKYSEEASSLNT